MLNNIGYGLGRGISCKQQGGTTYLDSVLSSVVFDIDATQAQSYPGTGVLAANLTASPADGMARGAYDFHFGDGTTPGTYPAFNGTAGDSGAYFSFDGDDYLHPVSGTNTGFFKNLHKTTGGTDFWFATAFRPITGTDSVLFGTTSYGGTGIPGALLMILSNGTLRYINAQNAGASYTNFTTAIAADTDYVLVFTRNSATGSTCKLWLNAVGPETKTPGANPPITNDPTDLFALAAEGNLFNSFIANGSRVYSWAMGNEYLDDTKAAAIRAHLGARHGRAYG